MMTKKQRRALLALYNVLKKNGTNFRTFNRRAMLDPDNIRRGENRVTIDNLTNPDLVSVAFTWEYTNEGHKFWGGVNSDWQSGCFKLRGYRE